MRASHSFITLFYFSLISTLFARRIGPLGSLEIVSKTVAPDGDAFARTAITAGGGTPGALISGYKGDYFLINVINNLRDKTMLQTTSIHWHGILQSGGSTWNDGAAFVSQCPISHGKSFLYQFHEPDQAGTFWYHSHMSTQYCDGLRGPMVVYDRRDPHRHLYDVDDEDTVITLADWYHEKAKNIMFGTSDTTLINGLGRYGGEGGTASPLTVIHVRRGRRYRFRFVNLSCDPAFTVSIDGHSALTIIEADGVNTQPLAVDSFQIFAGQRYSVVFKADQKVGNYWLRAKPNVAANTGFEGGINSAIIRYIGAPSAEPTTEQTTSTSPLVEANLVPLEKPGAPGKPVQGGADVKINLDMAFDISTLGFTVNGARYTSPTVPVLLQILSGAQAAHDLLPGGSVYNIKRGDVVEISMPALAAGGPHPFHLHGHTFDVVRAPGSTEYNYKNPPRRDVVSTGMPGDNVTIRFTADNPGPWFLHCHIDWHLEQGLAVVMAERPSEWNRKIGPSLQWNKLCPNYNKLGEADL